MPWSKNKKQTTVTGIFNFRILFLYNRFYTYLYVEPMAER